MAAATLEVAEAALTGESLPVSKGLEPVAAPDAPLGDRTDMVYMNTNVTRGTGELVVTSTGMNTEVGHISRMLQTQDESKSPLTVQLERLTKTLVTIAGLALVASMVLNMARGQSFTEVFTVAVAFSIAAIPTGLPAVVTRSSRAGPGCWPTPTPSSSACARPRRSAPHRRSAPTRPAR
jgi:Ca2+-transporting ATPase